MIDDRWDTIIALPDDAKEHVIRNWAGQYGVDADELVKAYQRRLTLVRGETEYTDLISRAEEYLALCSSRDDEPAGGYASQFRNEVRPAPPALSRWIDSIGAVSRLREVRTMAGFTRVEPYPVSGEKIAAAIQEKRVAPLAKQRPRWLPAAEIRGEGIFLKLQTGAIDEWIAANPSVVERAVRLNSRAQAIGRSRGYQLDYAITPRLLLIHSFAHAMIRQLSMDCGYSASSLRERLYVAEGAAGGAPMNGVLIYTGSPDSEGSLGGLVRLADSKLIIEAVSRAVRNARWCGSDPVCLESEPDQSGDRLSGAACHCCLLLPETACEKFNRELDRSTLIGEASGRWKGFFEGLGD